jgi:hypothetical protein
MSFFQAFCLPILQIVYETLKDIEEGKGSKALVKSKGKLVFHFSVNTYLKKKKKKKHTKISLFFLIETRNLRV